MPPKPGESSNGGLELVVSAVGLGVWERLSGERTPRSVPKPRLHRRLPPAPLPSDRWGLGVWFMMKDEVELGSFKKALRSSMSNPPKTIKENINDKG